MDVPSRLTTTTSHHNRLTALFPGPPGWAGAGRELLDFIVQGKFSRGRHTDHPAGYHSIRTNQCPPPPSPSLFYRPDALPATQPTVSKHLWKVITTTTTTTTVLQPFVRDYPGELVQEETFNHPSSWSSSNLYQLLPSTRIHSILPTKL